MELDIFKTRKENFKRIHNEVFGGSTTAMADKLCLSYSSISKYLSDKNSGREINSSMARDIEEKLGLSKNSLDKNIINSEAIYYIMLKVAGNHVADVVRMLRQFEQIQECSAIMGDFDVFMKVEVDRSEFLGLLLQNISKFPGVLRTRTLISVESIHWQRSQSESYKVIEREQVFGNFADEYVYRKVNKHFEEIRSVESGEVVIHDKDISFDRSEMLSRTKIEIIAVRLESELMKSDPNYLNAERERILSGVVSNRLIVVNGKDLHKKIPNIMKEASKLIDIGCTVKFLLESDWSPTQYSLIPESFAIFDNAFVYVRRTYEKKSILRTQPIVVKTYKDAFRANWNKALFFEEFHDLMYS